MAKIKGPLLSARASGRFARVLSFRDTVHGPVSTRFHYPGSRNVFSPSQAQLDQRAVYGAAVGAWRALTQAERDQWDSDAPAGLSGWNWYFKTGVSWSPVDIPGLQIWLRSDSIIGLSDTDPVTTWPDDSGNGWDASQSVATYQPIYRTGQVNGLPAVVFNGTDNFMSFTGAALNVARNVSGVSIFAVVNTVSRSNEQVIFSTLTPAGGTSTRCRLGRINAINDFRVGGRRLDTDSWQEILTGSYTADVWGFDTAVFDYANSDLFIYHDGSFVASDLSFQTDGSTSDTASASVTLGAFNPVPSRELEGGLAELIVYNTALSASDRALVDQYISSRYGIALV